eukprot:4323409-Prymnesium_polylepis.1
MDGRPGPCRPAHSQRSEPTRLWFRRRVPKHTRTLRVSSRADQSRRDVARPFGRQRRKEVETCRSCVARVVELKRGGVQREDATRQRPPAVADVAGKRQPRSGERATDLRDESGKALRWRAPTQRSLLGISPDACSRRAARRPGVHCPDRWRARATRAAWHLAHLRRRGVEFPTKGRRRATDAPRPPRCRHPQRCRGTSRRDSAWSPPSLQRPPTAATQPASNERAACSRLLGGPTCAPAARCRRRRSG